MATEIIYSHKEEVKILENKIIIPFVTIDDSRVPVKKFPLLFDTGAFITLVRKDRAERNNYKIIEENGCIISGFSEKGLVCDLRKIPTVVFCGFRMDDVLVATPHDDGVPVTEVLGMNILENFSIGLDFAMAEIYVNIRRGFVSQKPRYQCGSVSLFQDKLTWVKSQEGKK